MLRSAVDGATNAVVTCNIDALLRARGWSLQSLSEATGITRANLSVLKNGRARAIRFTTLLALCEALECDVGDLLSIRSAAEGPARHQAD